MTPLSVGGGLSAVIATDARLFAAAGSDVVLLTDTLCAMSAAFAAEQSTLAVTTNVALAPAVSAAAVQDTAPVAPAAGVVQLQPAGC